MKARRDVKPEQLAALLLFDGCSADELAEVARSVDEVAVPAGYVLAFEGDWGHEVFIVAEGLARVTASGRTLAVAGPNCVIGELAVLNPGRRVATVVAETAMRLLVFDAAAFDALLARSPVVARRVLAQLASRMQGADGAPERQPAPNIISH